MNQLQTTLVCMCAQTRADSVGVCLWEGLSTLYVCIYVVALSYYVFSNMPTHLSDPQRLTSKNGNATCTYTQTRSATI